MKDYLTSYVAERRLQKNSLQPREIEVPEVPEGIDEKLKAPFGTFGTELEVECFQILDTQANAEVIPYPTNEAEINWRVEAILPQIPDTGPIPFLVARECVEPEAGCCQSCGESLREGDAFRCAACSRAVNLALEMVLEGRKQDAEKEKRVS